MTAKSILATTAVLATLGQGPYVPARLDSGGPPPPRVQVITWGHDYVRLSVDASGRVQRVASLTPSAGVDSALRDAVRGWSFSPAREAGEPVPAEVLVAGVFRPATLHDPPGLDAPSGTVRSERREVPIPVVTPAPPYPVNAIGNGVVLIEVEVTKQGTVSTARVATATPGFAASALSAARRWRLQPRRAVGARRLAWPTSCSASGRRSSVGRSESNLTLASDPPFFRPGRGPTAS